MKKIASSASIFVTKTVPEILPWDLIDNYSKDSTIHGIKYFGERDRHWSIKLLWLSIFVLSIYCCGRHIFIIKENRREKPVMISSSKKLSPIFEIPFPAVTICSQSKVSPEILNFTKKLNEKENSMTKNELELKSAFTQVCDYQMEKSSTKTTNVIKILRDNSLSLNDTFEICRFASKNSQNCDEILHEVITDEGVCYTFNMLNHKDLFFENLSEDLKLPNHSEKSIWSLDKDYNSMEVKVFPRRVLGSGPYFGLSLKIRMDKNKLNKGCRNDFSGFRLHLHMPVDFPRISSHFYNIPFHQQTTLIVKPQMIYSSKDIKQYVPESRQCYFSNERKLEFFKIYTQSNCELECETKFIKKICGCVSFFMPHDNNTIICDTLQLECVDHARANYSSLLLQKKLIEKQLKRDIKHGKANGNDERYKILKEMKENFCNCLATCTSIEYDAEIDRVDYEREEEGSLHALVNIYFKNSQMTRLKRYEIYGWSDFLSNCGGVLGLFTGCSLISLVEIFYHVFIYCVNKINVKIRSIRRPIDVFI